MRMYQHYLHPKRSRDICVCRGIPGLSIPTVHPLKKKSATKKKVGRTE